MKFKNLLVFLLIIITAVLFAGCINSKSDIPKNAVRAEQCDPDKSSFQVILYREPQNIKSDTTAAIFIDDKICITSDDIKKGEYTKSAYFNFAEGDRRTFNVYVNGKKNSSITIKAEQKKQWLLIDYSKNDEVNYLFLDEIPKFD